MTPLAGHRGPSTMTDVTPLVVVAKVVAAGVGLLVTTAAYRASRRTGSVALRLLAVGSAVLTLGAALGGGLDRAVGLRLETGLLLSSLLLLAGFCTLAYSLFVSDPQLGPTDHTTDGRTGN